VGVRQGQHSVAAVLLLLVVVVVSLQCVAVLLLCCSCAGLEAFDALHVLHTFNEGFM
jgi:hypothetical protein